MENIVVGIDFSKNSHNAMRHAVAISLKNKAKVHLAWVKTASVQSELGGHSNANDYLTAIRKKLNEWVEECKHEAPESEIDSIVLEGKPALELTKYAANLSDAIIVMGTHGTSGFEELFVGSNAFRTINLSTVPVLVLREGIEINKDLTEILVPIDTSFETLQKIKYAVDCAKIFGAKINLLGVVNPVSSDVKHIINVQLQHAANMCLKANVRFDVHTIDVQEGAITAILNYAKKIDANLVIIMREEENDLSAVWMGTNTRVIVNNSSVPLLIIPNVNQFLLNK